MGTFMQIQLKPATKSKQKKLLGDLSITVTVHETMKIMCGRKKKTHQEEETNINFEGRRQTSILTESKQNKTTKKKVTQERCQ